MAKAKKEEAKKIEEPVTDNVVKLDAPEGDDVLHTTHKVVPE